MDDKWHPLLVSSKYGLSYPEDFDRSQEYEFSRIGDDNSFRMRLAEQSPYFNVAGLMWREVNQEAPHSTPEREEMMDGQQYNQWLQGKPTEADMKRQRELASAYSGRPLFGRAVGNYRGGFIQVARQTKP